MEGLIPLVLKTLKKKKTRQQYKCLSSGAAATQTYNIEDFYPEGYNYQYQLPEKTITGGGHRRNKSSIGDYYSNGFSAASPENKVVVKPKQQQLVRFSSHRFFSCVTADHGEIRVCLDILAKGIGHGGIQCPGRSKQGPIIEALPYK